jgi:hypothetical protein
VPDDERDPEDWEGVDFHVHEDGTRHATVNLQTFGPRPPWWRSPAMARRFRLEIILIVAYTLWTAVSVVLFGVHVANLLTSFAMLLLLFSIVVRSISAYRIGYAMGIQVFPMAMAQPSPKRAAELIERSSELWDPSPLAVSHTMEVERLEREVNKPKE